MKLFDSELKVMDVLWRLGDSPAGRIAKILKEEIGWNRNTTYTVIKKCIDKGAIERYEPNYMCRAAVCREDVRKGETEELIDKMFDGSKMQFLAAFLSDSHLSEEEISRLKEMIDKFE